MLFHVTGSDYSQFNDPACTSDIWNPAASTWSNSLLKLHQLWWLNVFIKWQRWSNCAYTQQIQVTFFLLHLRNQIKHFHQLINLHNWYEKWRLYTHNISVVMLSLNEILVPSVKRKFLHICRKQVLQKDAINVPRKAYKINSQEISNLLLRTNTEHVS
jgi:hypothetical protein